MTTDSNDAIKSGLMAREEVTTGPYDGDELSLAAYANGPKTAAQIEAAGAQSESIAGEFQRFLTLRYTEMAKAFAVMEAEWNERTNLSVSERRRLAADDIASRRKAFITNTDAERTKMLRELKAIMDNNQAVAKLYDSPLALLTSHGWSDPNTNRYLDLLRYAGPTEIAKAAARAINENNLALGAAVCAAIEGLDKSGRETLAQMGVSRQALAKVQMGAEFDRVQRAFQTAKNRFNECLAQNRAFVSGGSIPSLTQIEQALNKRTEKKS